MAKTLIDPHCHYHSCFPIGDYWDCAWDNFYRASVKSAQEPGEPILCLTDMSGTDWFGKIQQQSLSSLTSHWQVHSTNESEHFRREFLAFEKLNRHNIIPNVVSISVFVIIKQISKVVSSLRRN